MKIAVIADSHFHPEGEDGQSAYASDAIHNARNRAVVEWIRRAAPACVIHLGDVPHPVPGLDAHQDALAVARQTYAALPAPLYMVPGNHDVGDKPQPLSAAPGATDAKHAVFSAHWGPPYQCIDMEDCRFLMLDTPVINSGLPIEAAQWTWLEEQLASAGTRRIFVFVHYPPFLLHPDEPEHYDNLAEPGRSRLLALFDQHRVEAVFAGHVHHFFYARRHQTDYYILPSTAFMRPEYSELCRVAPGDEYGRNEGGKLGFFFLHIDAHGHRVEPVRTWGATTATAQAHGQGPCPPSALGVTLRHAWDSTADIPCDNLDPFRRKEARNDLALLACWEAGLLRWRLPLLDLARPATRARMAALAQKGHHFLFFYAGLPTAAVWALAADPLVSALELILPKNVRHLDIPPGVAPVWVSTAERELPKDGSYFSHFPTAGFLPDAPGLDALPGAGVVFRVAAGQPVATQVAAAVARAGALGRAACILVSLPRDGEGAMARDEAAVTQLVTDAWAAAQRHPEAAIYLDTFMDHDRGYHPRMGLMDRHGTPRPALLALQDLQRQSLL